MGFKDILNKYKEQKEEEKRAFKQLESNERMIRKLEEKKKTPAQKEYEFYQREENRERLNNALKQKRKAREQKLKKLNDPFNRVCLFNNKLEIVDGNMGFK